MTAAFQPSAYQVNAYQAFLTTSAQPQGGGGFVRLWNPLIEIEREEKEEIVAEARLVAREADTGAERKKAKAVARAVTAARTDADLIALAQRIEWVHRKAIEYRRQQDDDEIAVVLMTIQ